MACFIWMSPLETLYVNKFVALCLTLFETCLSFWSVLGDLPDFPGWLIVGGCWADQDGAVTLSTYLPLWRAGSWPHQYKLWWLQLVAELLCTHHGHWGVLAQSSRFGLLLLWADGCVIPISLCAQSSADPCRCDGWFRQMLSDFPFLSLQAGNTE